MITSLIHFMRSPVWKPEHSSVCVLILCQCRV
ncbi:brain protein I3, isoform CRA_a [Rattus norvegicus]|uniref:Brain protein I3, isoform CRA_a n=1 Tax=Rattus norvegicus TaxID=10116 RepID=A6K1H4_RAT|nr:brain protein I3, isoform CRA_a [Rattus norvegicus]EDL89632.1 brain protein I3, isoform CRA_a [Rattus norvegicus]